VPKDPQKGPRGPTAPPEFPITPPPSSFPSAEYSYILELVGTIQHELGKLTEAVESLKVQSKDQAKELKDIAKDVHAFKFGLKLIGGVFVLASAIIGFLLNHIAEVVQAYLVTKK